MQTMVNDMQDIAQMIKTARKSQGLTQVELAGVSGIGVRLISDLENGKVTCQVGKVLYVLHQLGIKVRLDYVE
jgi:y4mF family transcriptional regulator